VVISLDASLDKPLYAQIRDQIRERIGSGALWPGDRLEPSRELSRRLGVHRTTVSNAYAELEAEGLIQGTVGRGTYISPLAETLVVKKPKPRRPSSHLLWDSLFAQEPQDDSLGRLMASALEPDVISFAATHSSSELCPMLLVRRALDAVIRREGVRLLQYGSSDGYSPLKGYLVGRMRRDGMAVEPDEILVTHGCQQSLDLVCRTLVAPGDVVACENPTYTGLWHLFGSPSVHLIPLPVGPQGVEVDFIEAVLEQNKVKLLLVTPNFQNPTGRTMPLAARKRLLDLAVRYQVPVAEDDIYGALRFRGRDLPTLKALDTHGVVIYLNSFSKIGFPGFRVGWIAAPARVVERLRASKQRADLHTNLLGQAVLEEFGRRGWLDKLIRRACSMYERKVEILRRAVAQHFPAEAAVSYPEGGMSVWVELPAELDASELLLRARERKVIFAPSRYFYFQNPQHNAFRLCFSTTTDEQLERGVATLGELLKEAIRREKAISRGSWEGSGVALV
jgi:DNA-binding transcriptional MocR family regulator